MAKRYKPLSGRELKEKEIHLEPHGTGSGELRMHLAYPNHYWVAMSNLGFQAVYRILGQHESVTAERAFLPEESSKNGGSEKPWRTFESERLLSDCDLLGFSLSFETDYPHLLRMLGNARLLYANAEQRTKAAEASEFGLPILIAGGTSITLNPEPVADFVDVCVLGEAEELLQEIIDCVLECKRESVCRDETLLRLAQLEGVYVPKFYTPNFSPAGDLESYTPCSEVPARPERRFVKDLSAYPAYSSILTPETEFRSMFLTETGRGCEMGCRFCVAGYIYRPIRKRSEESIAKTVELGLQESDAVGFVGASVSSHRSIAKLAEHVAQKGARASLSSLMAQKVNRELAGSISESEYKTVALAPEAGTERLRRAAGKRVSNEQVIQAARELAEAGIRGFKLYFIVGLPTETAKDIDAIVDLVGQVRDEVIEVSRGEGRTAWVSLSVNPFIPKASTPFQWEPMLERSALERIIKRLREKTKKIPNVELKYESPRESYFQALLSRGDRRVSRLLYLMEDKGKDWKWLIKYSSETLVDGVPPIDYFVTRRYDFGETLPWEVVDSKVGRDLLQREALRAYGHKVPKRDQVQDEERPEDAARYLDLSVSEQ